MFKGGQLCVPKGSIREKIIKENHCGSLGGNFGVDKTLEQVRIFYFWPKLQTGVRRYVEECLIYQQEKGGTSNAGLYTSFPIPHKP